MGRDPGAHDDKGKNKYLPPTDEIPVTTGHDLICLSGSSSSPGLSDNISGDCLNLDDSVLFEEEWRFVDRKQELRQLKFCLEELSWEEELRPRELCRQELRQQELRPEELQEKLRWRELCREKLCWRELCREELRREGLLRKLRSECFVQGTSSATSVSSSISQGTITMHNPGSSGEVNGFAHENGDIKTGLGPTLRPLLPILTTSNMSDEIKSKPSQASDSSSSHGFASKDGDIEMGLVHALRPPMPIVTTPNVLNETTLEPSQASDSSSLDLVPSDPRLADFCSYHHAYERNWQRLATVVDPLLAVIVQIACSLVAFNGSSLVKDVLFYLLVFSCVLGFLYTLAGKWFHCTKMAVIGLVATALGFLMTMALVVMYKIR